VVEYTTDGRNWDAAPKPLPFEFSVNEAGAYTVSVRQIDRAGNISVESTPITFTLGNSCDLLGVSCMAPDGYYRLDSTLIFRFNFSGKVYCTDTGASGPSITIKGGTAGDTGDTVIRLTTAVPKASGDFFLEFVWNVPASIKMNPVTVTAITLQGVKRVADDTTPGGNPSTIAGQFSRPKLRVLSIAPTIASTSPTWEAAGVPTAAGTVAGSPSGNKSTITLTFSHEVWPEKGKITIKPATGWLIPPVLTTEEFSKIHSSLASTTDQNNLTTISTTNGYYVKTTHGLKEDAGFYVPDTSTKYVLNFTSGLTDATLRGILERAKYLWQELDVSVPAQVSGAGTNTITVTMDELPAGRVWSIEIDQGAFIDGAGNQFAGWTGAHNFWSPKTATPVIRVNRTSHNKASTNVADRPKTKTEYRIDCVTPGAAIEYGTSAAWTTANAVGTVSAATTGYTPTRFPDQMTAFNSNFPNISTATITGLTMTAYTGFAQNGGVVDQYLGTVGAGYPTIGDDSLDTARKDYIRARATRTSVPVLTASDSSYEGAFKTLMVYRGTAAGGATYLKVGGTTVYGGAATISGFPLSLDHSQSKTRYAYYDSVVGGCVWISWEIISVWYSEGMLTNDIHTAGTLVVSSYLDISQFNFRRYGNWGLRTGGVQ
jgi:hypothetical protein